MQSGKDTSRSAIGGTSNLGSQQQGNTTYGVMPEQIVKELQSAASAGPGTDFLVIQRVRQGGEPRIWSTGDPAQTKDLFRLTSNAFDKEPVG